MAKNRAHIVDRLLKLAELAASPNENEARNAAVQACVLLRDHRDLLFTEEPSRRAPTLSAPAKPAGRSAVHEVAAQYMEWRSFMRNNALIEVMAQERGFCASCGEAFSKGDAVTQCVGVAVTHRDCAGWWWNFEFPPRDDDIPF